MRKYTVKCNDADEIRSWLIEHIGPEDYRWWFDVNTSFYENCNLLHIGIDVWIELSPEEESKLTLFLLRWS